MLRLGKNFPEVSVIRGIGLRNGLLKGNNYSTNFRDDFRDSYGTIIRYTLIQKTIMEIYDWYWYTNINKGIDMKRLTASEIQLVKRTFEMVSPLADTFALIFYDRLFYLAPQVRPLFLTEMSVQREKLMNMMALIVRGLDQPELFAEELRQMGLRHASYRVEPDHYVVMIEAVIWALNECLGENLTEEMYSAWKNALTLVSDIMLEGTSSTA